MKQYLIIIILLFSISSKGQTGKFEIHGYSDLKERTIYFQKYNGTLRTQRQTDSVALNAKGEFKIDYYLEHPETIYLVFGKQTLPIWIKPNSSITIKLSDSTCEFSGPMKSYADYYKDRWKNRTELFQEYEMRNPGYRNEFGASPDRYFRIHDSISQGQLDYLNNYFAKVNLPGVNQFLEKERASVLYEDLYYKVQSADTAFKKFAFFQKKLGLQSLPTFDFTSNISMNDKSLLPLFYYQEFISTSIPMISRHWIAQQGIKFSFDLWMNKQMELVDSLSNDPYCNFNIKAIVLNNFVKQIKYTGRVEWAAKIYSLMAQLNTSGKENVLENSRENLDIIVKAIKFSKGKDAPPFLLTDTAGKEYTIESFRGKKVYIDVWATWCGPCIELQPAFDKLLKKYADKKNIIFISVSIDQTKGKWLAYIKKHQPTGLILYAGDGGWKTAFASDYDIHSIPRFILLDEKGKFIAHTAPHPDEPDEVEKFFGLK